MTATSWLLLTLPAAALLWWRFIRYETAYNYRRIQADEANDSLGFWFHLRRLLVRAAVAGLLATGGAWPAARGFDGLMAGQLAGFGGWFLFYFNPTLNLLRGKAKYYVSFSRTTAWLDQQLAARAVRAVPRGAFNDAELAQERAAYAARALRLLLAGALGAGVVAYGVAVGWILL